MKKSSQLKFIFFSILVLTVFAPFLWVRAVSSSDTITVGLTIVSVAPTLNFTGTATSTSYDGTVVLNWTGGYVANCTASGDWSGVKPTAGTETMSGLISDKIYTLSCTGSGGTVTKSVSVSVNVDLYAPSLNVTVYSNDHARFYGKTYANSTVYVTYWKNGGSTVNFSTVSDGAGNWTYTTPNELDNGSYRAVAYVKSGSNQSPNTDEVHFVVSSADKDKTYGGGGPIVGQYGFINYIAGLPTVLGESIVRLLPQTPPAKVVPVTVTPTKKPATTPIIAKTATTTKTIGKTTKPTATTTTTIKKQGLFSKFLSPTLSLVPSKRTFFSWLIIIFLAPLLFF